MDTTRIVIDLDVLTNVIDAARLVRPSKRLERAYEWLLPLASVTMIQVDRPFLIVDSATWSGTRYWTDGLTCACPAHGPCWHMEAFALVEACIAATTPAVPAPPAFAQSYITAQANMGRVTSAHDRRVLYSVSTTAARSSGLDELFA